MTVKTSLYGIGWKEEFRGSLEELVLTVNEIVKHAYAPSKFIFLKEFDKDVEFNVNKYITKTFFEEVILSLIDRTTVEGRLSDKTRDIRNLIYRYKDDYMDLSNYTKITLTNAQQISKYGGTKMHTAYVNNISRHFGNRLRMFVNLITKTNEKIDQVMQEIKRNGFRTKISKVQSRYVLLMCVPK